MRRFDRFESLLTVLEKVVTRIVTDSARFHGCAPEELKSRSVNIFCSNFQGSRDLA